jgi:hypothetical protein
MYQHQKHTVLGGSLVFFTKNLNISLLDDVAQFFDKYVEQKKQAHGANNFLANVNKYEYQIDLFFVALHILRPNIRGGGDMYQYVSNLCVTLPLKGKTDRDLALGFVECINKMGGPPHVIMTDGEGTIKTSGLFQIFRGAPHHIYSNERAPSVRRTDD